MMNTNINPFSEYGYQPQSGWTGRIMQLNEQGVDTETTVNFGKGFEPENPFLNPKDAFMQEVVDIAATVTDDELKSLFGEMPFGMTRRQALQEQIAAAYSVENNEKHVDFSKLQAIGNGNKVSTPFVHFDGESASDSTIITLQMLGAGATNDTNMIGVFFNLTDQRIELVITSYTVEDEPGTYDVLEDIIEDKEGYGYVTCATDGKNVFESPFGSFSLKTRSNGN